MIRDVKTEDSKEIVDIYNLLVSIITAQMKKVKKFIKNSDLKKLEY